MRINPPQLPPHQSIVGRHLTELLQQRQRAVHILQRQVGNRQIVARIPIVGLELDRFLVRLQRRGIIFLLPVEIAQIVVGIGRPGVPGGG